MKTGFGEILTFRSSAPVPTGAEMGAELIVTARACARQVINQPGKPSRPTSSWAIRKVYIPRIEDGIKRRFAEAVVGSLQPRIDAAKVKNVRINVVRDPDQLKDVMATKSGKPFTNWHTDFRIDDGPDIFNYRLAKASRRVCILDGAGTIAAVGDVEAPGAHPFSISRIGHDPEEAMQPFAATLLGADGQIIRGPRLEMGAIPLQGDFTTQTLEPGEWYEIPPDCLHKIPAEAELGRICITVDLCE